MAARVAKVGYAQKFRRRKGMNQPGL
jgi:hypothetical protein